MLRLLAVLAALGAVAAHAPTPAAVADLTTRVEHRQEAVRANITCRQQALDALMAEDQAALREAEATCTRANALIAAR